MQNKKDMQTWQLSSYLSGGNSAYLDELYESYLQNPHNVDDEWRNYFSSLPMINGTAHEISHADIRQQFLTLARQPRTSINGDALFEHQQTAVNALINAYRCYGHFAAKVNPLSDVVPDVPELSFYAHALNDVDRSGSFSAPALMPLGKATLKEIYQTLEDIYCHHIGFEYMYIRNQEEINWLQQHIESAQGRVDLSAESKKQLLQQLIAADGLEKYLGAKYVGQKRFSLEGSDVLIPLIHEIIHCAGGRGVKEIVLGMAHRGRLNVMVNVFGQPTAEVFKEFEGTKEYGMTLGDVKYHLGFSSDIQTIGGPLHLSLAFNPSHLEYITSVITGSVRARQDRRNDGDKKQVFPVIVHGDAALSGQGIVMETLNMSQTNSYGVGGSIHVVINNQIGFTTDDPYDMRSSHYCTDIAKMINAPVFRVNGDDPEAALYVARLALDYRMKFKKDVFIDLVCYRLHGHNEADEPAATQPLMYQKIRQHPAPRELYAKYLVEKHVCTQEETDILFNQYRDLLDKGQAAVATLQRGVTRKNEANWSPYINQVWDVSVNTGCTLDKLKSLGETLLKLPDKFVLQRQVEHMMTARAKMIAGEQELDWGQAEILAYAALLDEGYAIRISGQDTQRGTFAHRHAVLHHQETGALYTPLANLSKHQPRFEIYNSLLSESGAMGFEYGYASVEPRTLVIWEAQFGDFANGAQVIIDQFISSGWQKWNRLCGLVLFLPHGYEGMGPEHSSARLERYLQLSAQKNMQICVPSTPAQIFHLIRRQILRPLRIPLIVMTPKSLLRHKLAVSKLEELAEGKFQLVIPEFDDIKPENVHRVVICSGKVYYELLMKRRENKQENVAILRIEQLYPFPKNQLSQALSVYKDAKEIVWCQEEPINQGAWNPLRHNMEECLREGQSLRFAGRPALASPAPGYPALHVKSQTALVEEALT